MANVLRFRQRSIVLNDAGAAETREYVRLEEQYRTIASLLRLTAQAMADARDLPMAEHDVKMLASAENAGIFGAFVKSESELAELLKRSLEQEWAMLAQMRAAG